MNDSLAILRADYRRASGRSIALPIAGAIVWAVVGAAGAVLPARQAALVLLFGSGAIFPVGLLLARVLGERLLDDRNPLARLMGLAVLMVNLLWPVHIAFYLRDPSALPLSVGIGLGVHWIVFGWIAQHRVGLVHAISRTVLVTAAWLLWPAHRYTAVPVVIVAVYVVTIAMLARVPPSIGTARAVEA